MDDIYVNKHGFKCVRSQLAKTEGRDPQEYEKAKTRSIDNDGKVNPAIMKTEVAKLRVRVSEYTEDDA